VVGVPTHGTSVKSMLEDCRLTYSAVESVKMGTSRVFIAGPAGYQSCEHAPDAP